MITRATPNRSARIGLAMAGGGPEGAVYEIGVVRALDEALDGVDFNRLPVYVGVSAGAFIAANLANGLTTGQNVRAMFKHEPGEHPFHPETFFTPAFGEMFRRGLMTPGLFVDALWTYLRHSEDLTFVESLLQMSRALPIAVFNNEPIRAYLERIYTMNGRTNDFRKLKRRLFIVATELDSGHAVRFGDRGYDDVPISTAVQASSALPGLYPPVMIGGRHYVDGVLLKTMHASVAFDHGASLCICINPLVPVDTLIALDEKTRSRHLADLGLPTVLSQGFRTLVHSRMQVGIKAYAPRYPDKELVLIEPQPDDYRMFFTNIFRFSQRKAVCEYAYKATRRDLLRRYDELAPVFARHGVRLRKDVLADPTRDLWTGVGLDSGTRRDSIKGVLSVERALHHALDRLDAFMTMEDARAAEHTLLGPRARRRSRPRRAAATKRAPQKAVR
jgi:predicted acylesterase/phospholipase RssA